MLLAIYSGALIRMEMSVSQDYVRYYFTDITGPVRFYAVNTTISVFLLWSTAVIFTVCILCLEQSVETGNERKFYLSQILIFGFLGFDDRFQIHEWLGSRLGIEDALIILALAIVELLLLLTLGKLTERPKGTRYYIYLAALFLGLMILIDGWVPRELVPRLSLEDLSKTWATVFIFLFAWSICAEKIATLRRAETS